jgi:hypothetical protein
VVMPEHDMPRESDARGMENIGALQEKEKEQEQEVFTDNNPERHLHWEMRKEKGTDGALHGMVLDFLEGFRYKPDTVFYIGSLSVSGVSIVASRKVPDSRDPKHPLIHVRAEMVVPAWLMQSAHEPHETLQIMVHDWIRKLEMHECDEWFRVGGELPYDPHRER